MDGKIKVMCEFPDAKQKSDFYVAKTDSKTVLVYKHAENWGWYKYSTK